MRSLSDVYRVEFVPAEQSATGATVSARTDTCWLCDEIILTFDKGRYLICGDCYESYMGDTDGAA